MNETKNALFVEAFSLIEKPIKNEDYKIF